MIMMQEQMENVHEQSLSQPTRSHLFAWCSMSDLELRAIPLLLVVSPKVATLLEGFTGLSTSKDLAPKAL